MSRPITPDEFIKLLTSYNFLSNSINSFCEKYKVNPKTVVKYLKANNISYNQKGVINLPPRDNYGRFTLNLQVKKTETIKKEVKFQEPLKKCRSLKDLNNL